MELLTHSKEFKEQLNNLGIFDTFDVLNYLPYRYEDFAYTDEKSLEDHQRVVIAGRLVSNPKLVRTPKIDIITFYFVSNNNNFYAIKIFNRSFYSKVLNLQDTFTFSGIYNASKKEISVINIIKGEIEKNDRFRPIYHLSNKIKSATYCNLVKRSLEAMKGHIDNILPLRIQNKYRLLSHEDAINQIHFPKSEEEISNALRTLKYEECLEYCINNLMVRKENMIFKDRKFNLIDPKKINDFVKQLSFKLSFDQLQAIKEIILDMNDAKLMYRLLQGDVGTGKTIVALCALYGNYLRHQIGAFMVPTDALARQQYEEAKKILEPFGMRIALFIGSLTPKEKKDNYELLRNGKIDLAVGTHALFSKDVVYPSLGLVVIDEQHKFGVNQRNMLASKGDGSDLLLMSATPIPRTLSMALYADLDVSSLTMFPFKKRDVKTKVITKDDEILKKTIDYCLRHDKRIFIVAPKIKESEEDDNSVEKIYETYHSRFKDQVGLLHGKLTAQEKVEVLKQFKDGELKFLVSTTVIELGINVPSAGAIIIYGASSFGLATLHQLRGRVGRDGEIAFCILIKDCDDDEEALERLKYLESTENGYDIAEFDMKSRGPGDIVGVNQSGFPSFSCLNLISDYRMFDYALKDAKEILESSSKTDCDYIEGIAKRRRIKETKLTLFE